MEINFNSEKQKESISPVNVEKSEAYKAEKQENALHLRGGKRSKALAERKPCFFLLLNCLISICVFSNSLGRAFGSFVRREKLENA